MKKLFPTVFCAIIGLSVPSHAWASGAADPVLIGNYDGWKVYSFNDKGAKVCFMSRQPEKQVGKFKKRGQVFFFVTHWPGDKDKNVVSLSNGYSFKPKSQATLIIKGRKFPLFVQGDMAWTKDGAEDNEVVKELEAGVTMTIKGTSSRGTDTTDTYSLKGSTEAYQAISKDCGAAKAPAAKEKG